MSNFDSIIQEDKNNINASGSNIKPYALSNNDISKSKISNYKTDISIEKSKPIQDININNTSANNTNNEELNKEEVKLEEQQAEHNKQLEQDVNNKIENINWDTLSDDQKLILYSKNSTGIYDFYIPQINKFVRTNTNNPKEINRLLALNYAKTKAEKDAIFSETYFDKNNSFYLGPINSPLTTMLKGVGSVSVDTIKGAVQFIVANRANNRINHLKYLFDKLSDENISPEIKNLYVMSSDIMAPSGGFSSLTNEQKKEFISIAYNKYIENTNKEIDNMCKFVPDNEKINTLNQFNKLVKDPIEMFQESNKDEYSKTKLNEWINNNKEYISPVLLENQKILEQEFKNNVFFATMENDAKIKLTQLSQAFSSLKESLHLNYIPDVDSPYAYQIGELGFSYAGSLVALASGNFELALLFAASQFGDTIDKAIEKGLPLDISTQSANITALYQYVTEKMQLNLFRSTFSGLANYLSIGMLNTVVENALQEGIQDFGTKLTEQLYGVDSFTFEDYVLDFCINAGIGALMSIPMGAIVHYQKAKNVNKIIAKNPDLSKTQALKIADLVITKGTEALSTPEGKKLLLDGIYDMTKNISNKSIESKSSENVDKEYLSNMQKSAFNELIQPLNKEEKLKHIQDTKDAKNFTTKYLTERIGMFESEAEEMYKGLNNLYTSLNRTLGISKKQIAERLLPSSVNMMAISAMNNYKNQNNKNNYIKFEASLLKVIFKNLGPIDHLTDIDFINMAKDSLDGKPMNEIADKYKVLYQEDKYNLLRNQTLIDKLNLPALAVMLKNSNFNNKELNDSLNSLLSTKAGTEEYIIQLNKFNYILNNILNDKKIAGALFSSNSDLTNILDSYLVLFMNKSISGLDIHEITHIFDIIYYSNQLSAKLGLPTTSFNIKIMNLYNNLGKKITGNKDFVYNPFDYESKDQIKVAEALPNIMAQYLIDGKEYDKDSSKLIKYISSLYKYTNSTMSVSSEYADTKEAKELVKEIQKQEKEDELSLALNKLSILIDRGVFTNKDIYDIVKDLKLNEGLKLAIYIEKGQNPIITLLQAINDINNTRVDSMYRKSIDYNEEIIPSKNLIIPENVLSYSEDNMKANIEEAKKEYERSDKSIRAINDIYFKHDVYKSEDGSWNYIISDKDIKFNESTLEGLYNRINQKIYDNNNEEVSVRLSDLISHKPLFYTINPNFTDSQIIFKKDVLIPYVVHSENGDKLYLSQDLVDSNINVSSRQLKPSLIFGIQQLLDSSANNMQLTDFYTELYKVIKDNNFDNPKEFLNILNSLNQSVKEGKVNPSNIDFINKLNELHDNALKIYSNLQSTKRANYSMSNADKDINMMSVPNDYYKDKSNKPTKPTKLFKENNITNNQLSKIASDVLNTNNKQEEIKKDIENEDLNLNLTVSEIMSNNFSKTFTVVSEKFKKDSPKLFAHLRSAMYKSMQDVKRYKQQAKDLVIEINKMSKEDKLAFKKAWNNRDFNSLINIADKYDIRNEIVAIRASLNEMHKIVSSSYEGESYNQLLGYLQNYFPRLVIDHDGLASYLVSNNSDKGTVKTDTAETNNNKFDKWMDNVKSWLEDDLNYSKKKIGSPYFYKQRQIEIVDDEMLKFYAEPTDAFDNYINKIQDILFRKYFFGNGYVKEFMNSADNGKKVTSINGIDYVIPNWKKRIKDMGFLTGDKKTDEQILYAIESVFFRGETSSWNAIYRTGTNILTINSFFSALSNLGDLALTLYNYGFKNTTKAIKDVALKDVQVTTEDLGIEDLYEEFKTDGTKLKKIFNWTIKWSGFKYMDIFTKDINIQAALLNAKETLQQNGEKTNALIDKIYMYMGGDEESANALIANIINNNWKDEDVKLFVFNELSNQQPITKLEVPAYYNKYPQFRSLYLYKTFAIKQLNFAYANIISGIKDNPKEGFKKLIKFMAWLMAVGVTKDVIADMLKGKKINLTDSAMFSITSFFFLNEYNYYTFKNKGFTIGVFNLVTPPVPLLNEISSDIKNISKGRVDNPFELKTIKGVPVIGKPFYYWFGK